IFPEGLGTVLDEAAAYKLPIVVTENGLADASDANRPRYLAEHLYEIGDAVRRGADVRGYFHWSLLDNFEWASGFCPRFGLATYDPVTKKRTLRPSGATYKSLIRAGKVTRADIDRTPAYTAPKTSCN
ncbi:MAG: glycoside hydrolase family 1 protein, partial [Myxococcales bacterium]|nr:glycoside hydrolase family 1 protein [Myxococcales bacterium]